MKKILCLLFICVFLIGCGKEKEDKEIQKENNKKEIITMEETEEIENIENKEKEEINIIYSKDYELDGEKIQITLDENCKVIVIGNAKTEEKASLLLTTFTADMYGIDYSVAVMFDDLFMSATSNAVISGKNTDGSISYGIPDWYEFPEDDLGEELETYKKEIKEIENDFLENVQDFLKQSKENESYTCESKMVENLNEDIESDSHNKGHEAGENLKEKSDSIDWGENKENAREAGEKAADWINDLIE